MTSSRTCTLLLIATGMACRIDGEISQPEIIRAAAQAVVRVHATGDMAQGIGSGFFFIARSGGIYVATNHHVVWGATEIRIERSDGSADTASVMASDPATDLALLRPVAAEAPAALSFGDDIAVKQGDWVCSLGSAGGVFNAASTGILSARGRLPETAVVGQRLVDHLFIDAVVGPGSSGGPVVDARGSVVGINTAVLGASRGLGVAVPAQLASEVMTQLEVTGHASHASLGIDVVEVASHGDDRARLRVARIAAPVGAEDADVRVGDQIVRINDEPAPTANMFRIQVFDAAAGMSWRLGLLRDGQQITRVLKLRDVEERR